MKLLSVLMVDLMILGSMNIIAGPLYTECVGTIPHELSENEHGRYESHEKRKERDERKRQLAHRRCANCEHCNEKCYDKLKSGMLWWAETETICHPNKGASCKYAWQYEEWNENAGDEKGRYCPKHNPGGHPREVMKVQHGLPEDSLERMQE